MKYVGSKARHAKHMLPIILAGRDPSQYYVEPFVGGANVLDKVTGRRLGSDSNEYLIHLLIMLRDGWVPPDEISKEQYFAIRANPDGYPKELTAFAMFGCSFGSNWGNGYGRERRKDGKWHGVADRSSRACVKQGALLKGALFVNEDYRELNLPKESIVYCDPPYADSVRRYTQNGPQRFDTPAFWKWAETLPARGHRVFVSEYRAPEGWRCVWEREVRANINKNSYQERLPGRNDPTKDRVNVERLFVPEGQK